MELCTNFEELGGIWEYHHILSPKIVVWGVRIVGNWVENFRKNGVGWGDCNKGRENGSVRQGFVQLIYKLAATNFENLR